MMTTVLQGMNYLTAFKTLCSKQKSGLLRIVNNDLAVKIFVWNGNVVFASGPDKAARLGIVLRRRGLISEEQLLECLQLSRRRKKTLGKVVVDEGLLSKTMLEEIVRQQAEETFLCLLNWGEGAVEFMEKSLRLDVLVTMEMHPLRLLLKASRRVDDMRQLRRNIADKHTVFSMVPTIEFGGGEVCLSSSEWRVLAHVDGKVTVDKIVTQMQDNEFLVYKALNTLYVCDFIRKKEEKDNRERRKIERDISCLINLYHEALNVVRKSIVPDIGQRAYEIFDKCKRFEHKEQYNLMRYYDVSSPSSTNIKKICDYFEERESFGNEIKLVNKTFNKYIENIFEQLYPLLGKRKVHRISEEIRSLMPYFKNLLTKEVQSFAIIEELERLLKDLQKT